MAPFILRTEPGDAPREVADSVDPDQPCGRDAGADAGSADEPPDALCGPVVDNDPAPEDLRSTVLAPSSAGDARVPQVRVAERGDALLVTVIRAERTDRFRIAADGTVQLAD